MQNLTPPKQPGNVAFRKKLGQRFALRALAVLVVGAVLVTGATLFQSSYAELAEKQAIFVDQNANVGIGTDKPTTALDVVGTVKATAFQGDGSGLTGLAAIGGKFVNGTDAKDAVYTGGQVGIGTDKPVGSLHVSQPGGKSEITFTGSGLNNLLVDDSGYNGTGVKSFSIKVQNPGPTPNLIIFSTDGGTTWTEPIEMARSGIKLGSGVSIGFAATSGHTYGDQWDFTVTESFMDSLVVVDGKVGIGTASPTEKLEVTGNVAIGHRWNTANPTHAVNVGKPDEAGSWNAGSAYIQFKDYAHNAGVNAGTSIAFHSHKWGGGTNEAMRVAANSNVGIGTTEPQAKLDVVGKIHAQQICDEGGQNCKDLSAGWTSGSSAALVSTILGSVYNFQDIATQGAREMEAFTLNQETYLAVANHHNDATHNINSKIYKWNGSRFLEVQSLATQGVTDMEVFTLNQETYLAVANYYNGSTHNINSKIYKWNGSRFLEVQSLATQGALDMEAFTLNQETYLAVANYHNDSTYNINSKIYKWNGSRFLEVQSLATQGAREMEAFTLNQETYLAVANHHNGSTYNINSKIYKWNGSRFLEVQSLATQGALDMEAFTLNQETYLAVANYHNDSTYNINSKIYKWNGSRFLEVQSLATQGARDMEAFTLNQETYLAVANYHNDSTRNINSKIYKWNGSRFLEVQSLATQGALEMEVFTLNQETYLAVANHHNDSTYNINSKIYQLSLELTSLDTTTDLIPNKLGTLTDHKLTKWSAAADKLVDSSIFENGNVGIGTTAPSYKLDVAGTIRGNNVSPSDLRLKQNIQTLENSLAKISQLRGVSFNWQDPAKDPDPQIGVIAQEVEQVLPELVSTDEAGYKSVAYGKFVSVLLEAVKELQKEKDAEIQALKAKNSELTTRIEALEAKLQ